VSPYRIGGNPFGFNVFGSDFNRMVFEFTMLNQGKVCAISTAAMDDLDGRRDVKPDQRRSNLSGCAK
jgi:hypothetical protein